MTKTISPLMALAATFAAAGPAKAEDGAALFKSLFADVRAGAPCYARTYDGDHLKKHPEQRVAKFEIDMTKENPNGRANTADGFEIGVGVMPKGSSDWYTGVGICKAAATDLACFLEGDGGSFTMSRAENGGVRLKTGDYGISFEGAEGFLELSGKEGDDKVFDLPLAAQDECNASTAELNQPSMGGLDGDSKPDE